MSGIILKILTLVKQYPLILLGIGTIVLSVFLTGTIVSRIQQHLFNSRIEKLEKNIRDYQDHVLKLQGQVEQKEQEIAQLNEKISDSDKTVEEAGKKVKNARKHYEKTRETKEPEFKAPTLDERVKELTNQAKTLYPIEDDGPIVIINEPLLNATKLAFDEAAASRPLIVVQYEEIESLKENVYLKDTKIVTQETIIGLRLNSLRIKTLLSLI